MPPTGTAQAAKRLAQRGVRGRRILDAARLIQHASRAGDILKDSVLMAGIASYGLDEVGDEARATLELHIDPRPLG